MITVFWAHISPVPSNYRERGNRNNREQQALGRLRSPGCRVSGSALPPKDLGAGTEEKWGVQRRWRGSRMRQRDEKM